MTRKIERYTLIVGRISLNYLSYIFLLQCRTSDDFRIQVTDNNLSKAEELLKLFSNLGIEEESRKQKEIEIKNKEGKVYKQNITEIKCRKIGAIRT